MPNIPRHCTRQHQSAVSGAGRLAATRKEEAGRLDCALRENDVDDALKGPVRLLEPCMTTLTMSLEYERKPELRQPSGAVHERRHKATHGPPVP